MTAQIANGGFKIYPKITVNENDETYETVNNFIDKNKKINMRLKNGLVESSEGLFSL